MAYKHTPLKRALTLALSHREKAERLLHQLTQDFDHQEISESDYAPMAKMCREHIQDAQRHIERARASTKDAFNRTNTKLERLRHKQRTLHEASATGKLSPDKANQRNRGFLARLAELQAEQQQLHHLLEARRSLELDGFVDLPLDHYTRENKAPEGIRGWASLTLEAIVPFFVALTVFLPWVNIASSGQSISLYAMAVELALLPKTFALNSPAYYWTFFFVLPLVALPFIAMSNNRLAGLGICSVGLAAVVLTPLVLFTPLLFSPDLLPSSPLEIHIGAYAYLLGGVILTIAGLLRYRVPRGSTRISRMHIVAPATLLLILSGGFAWSLLVEQAPRMTLDAKMVTIDSQLNIAITCCNQDTQSVQLYLPWPDGLTEAARETFGEDTFGLRLLAHSSSRGDYRLLPATMLDWRLTDREIPEIGASTLVSGQCMTVNVGLSDLSELVSDTDGLRIELTSPSGVRLQLRELTYP